MQHCEFTTNADTRIVCFTILLQQLIYLDELKLICKPHGFSMRPNPSMIMQILFSISSREPDSVGWKSCFESAEGKPITDLNNKHDKKVSLYNEHFAMNMTFYSKEQLDWLSYFISIGGCRMTLQSSPKWFGTFLFFLEDLSRTPPEQCKLWQIYEFDS